MNDTDTIDDQTTEDADQTDTLSGDDTEKTSDTEDSGGPDKIVDETEGDTEETFPREYVEKLRQENGKYRQRAQRADELAHRLHRELVRSDGRLQDPTDLDFSDDHLTDDGERLAQAIDDLLQRKPHLAARRPSGDVGQGAATSSTDVNLLGILRGN